MGSSLNRALNDAFKIAIGFCKTLQYRFCMKWSKSLSRLKECLSIPVVLGNRGVGVLGCGSDWDLFLGFSG